MSQDNKKLIRQVEITHAAIQINQSNTAFCDVVYFGDNNFLFITLHSLDRPSGDLPAQRKEAIYTSSIDLDSSSATKELDDALSTLNSFLAIEVAA